MPTSWWWKLPAVCTMCLMLWRVCTIAAMSELTWWLGIDYVCGTTLVAGASVPVSGIVDHIAYF